MPGVNVLQTSRFHESKPVGGPAGQPAFLNGACLLETELPPQDLLNTLQAVENTLERQRDIRWGPRTVDLDLLLYDSLEINREDLTVPHPRMTTRRFVLEPCVEIAPDFVHPASGCSVRDLLENISPTHRRISICGVPGSGAAEVANTLADATIARVIHGCVALAQTMADDCHRYRRFLERPTS
jgi:2-amino-4-hydroxy-6-hydroxymethyldihydropteridine diphosphokinase